MTPSVSVENTKARNCDILVPTESSISLQVVEKKRPQTAVKTKFIPVSKLTSALPDTRKKSPQIQLTTTINPEYY